MPAHAFSELLPAVIRPSYERADDRGLFWELLNSGQWCSVVHGKMKPNAVMGNHYHERTEVFFFLLTGRAQVICADPKTKHQAELTLQAREGLIFKRNIAHAIRFQEESLFLMLKSEPYQPEDPDTFAYSVL